MNVSRVSVSHPVLDSWENQRGVSNVFLTYFDYFCGGQYKLGGREAPEWGLTPPPRQIEHWSHHLASLSGEARSHVTQCIPECECKKTRLHDSETTQLVKRHFRAKINT